MTEPVNRRDLLRMSAQRLAAGERRPPPGSSPGTLPSRPAAERPCVYAMAYGPHEMTEFAVPDLEQLRALRGRFPVMWVDVDGNGHTPTVETLGEIFGLHGLAVEVATEPSQASAELFQDHLLVIAKMVRLCPELDVEQVAVFAGTDFVITIQERPGDTLEPVRERIRRGVGRIRRTGPDYLLYALLDAMVDNYFPVAEHYMDRLDELEVQVIEHPGRAVMLRLHTVRRDQLSLRRAIYPMREAVRALVRDPSEGLVTPETLVYLRDVQEHTVQAVDLVESSREMATSLTDLYLSFIGHRANDIMKVLTIFAAVFIPLGFITGVYGMNVDEPPRWLRSLGLAEAAMAAVTIGLIVLFWKRGWIRDG